MKLSDYERVEGTNIDFKEKVEYNKPKSWLKLVSAFANSNGGLIRILFSYRDFDMKPSFFSDVSFFKVIFPNRNYTGKIQNTNENIISDEDYFILM